MARRGAKGRARSGKRREPREREWIGGLLSPPFFLTDRDEPYRPRLVVWLDTRDRLIVGQEMVVPEDTDGAVARVLLAAMERPLDGPPRRPTRVRVADASVAAEVRAVLGADSRVKVAPTPELDALLETLLELTPDDTDLESYLEHGLVTPAAVAKLFAAAEVVYRIAPWRVATDDQVLCMDIPALGVEGACVSIIGNLGESLGILIFPSLVGYDAFVQAADDALANGPIDLGTDWLALSFERGADLPVPMRREVAKYGWPVADANAYPRVERFERDAASRPLVERDVEIACACATALAGFFGRHRDLFERDEFEPTCESYFDESDVEVRLTLPYEAFALFEVDDGPQRPSVAGTKVGRNEPCPCGSGKKYKKCHLLVDDAERSSSARSASDHDLDGRLTRELVDFAMARFGFEWQSYMDDFDDSNECGQLSVPWSVYCYQVQGQTVVDWYLAERDRRMSRQEKAWLAAQKAAWLSVWEVIDVEPGATVTLRDQLSHEERCVREARASRTLIVRDALLGRVVDHDGVALLCGAHVRPLPPLAAAEVVRRARGRLRRTRAVPVERLRGESFGRYLIKRWEEAVRELDVLAATPPVLRNTDGDELLITIDRFEILSGAHAELQACLAGLEGVEPDRSDPDRPGYVFLAEGNRLHASWHNTTLGRAWIAGDVLRIETNSRERADALRARVESAADDLIRHRVREHSDPLSQAAMAATPRPPEDPPPEVEQLLLDFTRRHYAGWVDQSVPALGGQTPREAARTAKGRAAVDVLLKDMENHEHRSGAADIFDFTDLRRELNLEP